MQSAGGQAAREAADDAIMGDKSRRAIRLRELMEQGYTEEAAQKILIEQDIRAMASIAPIVAGGVQYGAARAMRAASDIDDIVRRHEYGDEADPSFTDTDMALAEILQEDAPRKPFTDEVDGGIVEEIDVSSFLRGNQSKYFEDTQLKTEPNISFFWSGKSNGIGGPEVAAQIAKSHGGVTLETTLETQGIAMPEFDIHNADAVEAWKNASATYAHQVSGEVHAIIGSTLNPNGVWATIELPILKNNPKVTKIITIDPETLQETTIFTR